MKRTDLDLKQRALRGLKQLPYKICCGTPDVKQNTIIYRFFFIVVCGETEAR